MKELIKNYLAYAVLIGMAGFWLFTFVMILAYGEIGYYEDNLAILIPEIILCAAALTLGIERTRWLIRTGNGRRKL